MLMIRCTHVDSFSLALNVKVVGTHAGISIGEDGPSQMGIEDVGLACSLPNFTVVVPADEASTEQGRAELLLQLTLPAYLHFPGVQTFPNYTMNNRHSR